MKEERARQLDVFFSAFSSGRISDFVTINKIMNAEGVTFEELEDYKDLFPTRGRSGDTQITKRGQEILEKLIPKCPRCETLLQIQEVGNCQGNKEKKYKVRWLCPKGWAVDDPTKYCGFEALDKRSMKEVFAQAERTGKISLPEENS